MAGKKTVSTTKVGNAMTGVSKLWNIIEKELGEKGFTPEQTAAFMKNSDIIIDSEKEQIIIKDGENVKAYQVAFKNVGGAVDGLDYTKMTMAQIRDPELFKKVVMDICNKAKAGNEEIANLQNDKAALQGQVDGLRAQLEAASANLQAENTETEQRIAAANAERDQAVQDSEAQASRLTKTGKKLKGSRIYGGVATALLVAAVIGLVASQVKLHEVEKDLVSAQNTVNEIKNILNNYGYGDQTEVSVEDYLKSLLESLNAGDNLADLENTYKSVLNLFADLGVNIEDCIDADGKITLDSINAEVRPIIEEILKNNAERESIYEKVEDILAILTTTEAGDFQTIEDKGGIENAIDFINETLSEMQSELLKQITENGTLTIENGKLKVENSELSEENQKLLQEKVDLANEIIGMQAEMDALKAQNEESNKNYSELLARYDELVKELNGGNHPNKDQTTPSAPDHVGNGNVSVGDSEENKSEQDSIPGGDTGNSGGSSSKDENSSDFEPGV